ncbi:leucine-rich repeat-containing protein 25-like isoform X2 [Dendropsophus ebraccatus]
MWAVMMLMIFLHAPANTQNANNRCSQITDMTLNWSHFSNCTTVQLKNKNIIKIETSKKSNYGKLTVLDISNNNLTDIPEDFLSTAVALKEVHLEYNRIEHLPKMFLLNSTRLENLTLEGNSISEIPRSVFHETLINLTVECRCDLVGNIMMHINVNATKYARVAANSLCIKSTVWKSLKDFYEENCDNQYLALYIALPILMVGLTVGSVALYMWKRKRTSSLENKGAADKSPAHGQPRYMSRNMESTESTFSPGHRQDYENVFVGHVGTSEAKPHGYLENDHERGPYRSKHVAEEDIYLESDINDGEQPIYTNTQGVYYNYSEPNHMKNCNKEDDDVYILPDH